MPFLASDFLEIEGIKTTKELSGKGAKAPKCKRNGRNVCSSLKLSETSPLSTRHF